MRLILAVLVVTAVLLGLPSAGAQQAASLTVTVFTAGTWAPPVGGGAYFHDGVITQISSIRERKVWEIPTDTYTRQEVLNDTCGWSSPPCPKIPQTASFGIAWTGKVAYLLGGAQSWLEDMPTPKIFRYDPLTHTITDTGVEIPILYPGDHNGYWTDGAALWDPVNRWVAMFGAGNYEHYLDSFAVFDPERGTVERRAALPRTGDNACAVYWPERGTYVWGGGHAGGKFYGTFYEIQPSGAWRLLGELPVGTDYPACMIVNGHLIVAGGQLAGDHGATDAVWDMDLATGAVTLTGRLPAPVMPYSWASEGNKIWLVSGGKQIYLVQAD